MIFNVVHVSPHTTKTPLKIAATLPPHDVDWATSVGW
jgi:hypothetical protein